MKKTIKVVAAIIENEKDEILCALRSPEMSLANLWEFPGGKVEKDESYERALIREIKEELNADIEVNEYIGESIYQYPEKDIKLIFYKAKLLSDRIELLEHESYKWITKDEKDKYEFAGADKVVFDLI